MKIRILASIVFFGLVLIAAGCMTPHEVTGGKKNPPSDNSNPGSIENQEYVPGQILVKLKPGVDTSALEILSRDLGLVTLRPLNLPGTYLMKIMGNDSVDHMMERLKAYDVVEYSEPDFKMKTE